MMDKKTFIIAGIAIALIIAAVAPFIASSNPDGLESAFFGIFGAKDLRGSTLDEEMAGEAEERVAETTGNDYSFNAPFPDYSIEGFDKLGEVAAVIIGTLVVVVIAFGLSRVVARKA